MAEKSAAEKTANAVLEYLEECDRAERWPDRNKVEEIFAQHFAPIVPRMITLRQAWKSEVLNSLTPHGRTP